MQTYSTLNDAKALAKFAHFNQKDKAGFDYYDHPARVLAAVQSQGAPPYVLMAAILHDVTEDTKFTHQMLLDLGFSEAVVELLKLLDRDYSLQRFYAENSGRDFALELHKGRRWFMSLGPDGADEFYYNNIRDNHYAKMIKLADIADNTQPWRLNYLHRDKQVQLGRKYAKALRILNFMPDFVSDKMIFNWLDD